MIIRKFNFKTREYDPYEISDDWHISLYENDMKTVINCAQCGEQIFFGGAYTSRQLHTNAGFGYMVCDKCYDKEWAEEKKNR